MPKQPARLARPAKAPPPLPSLAVLAEKARRIQAQTQETIRQLAALREQIRITREREDKPASP
ncbi:MAG: hypothetical protein JWM41_3722 [Gemmatimonadetes bacterium]|nr:hypothetical protein [Gemmatimonadota bacterium]